MTKFESVLVPRHLYQNFVACASQFHFDHNKIFPIDNMVKQISLYREFGLEDLNLRIPDYENFINNTIGARWIHGVRLPTVNEC